MRKDQQNMKLEVEKQDLKIKAQAAKATRGQDEGGSLIDLKGMQDLDDDMGKAKRMNKSRSIDDHDNGD